MIMQLLSVLSKTAFERFEITRPWPVGVTGRRPCLQAEPKLTRRI